MTPKARIDAVKDVLRGMGMHGCVSEIETAWNDLRKLNEHVVSGYIGENVKLVDVLKQVNNQMHALREEFPSQRVSHIIQKIEEALG